MAEAYIIDAARTAVGKRGGALSKVHPADLGAHILKAIVERSGVDPNTVDDVIFGCIDQVGPQAGDIARTSWLAAGFPEDVPGVTIDRQCGSSQQAVHFAAQAVMSGTMDVVIAGGVQNMSLIPIGSAGRVGKDMELPHTFHGSEGWVKRYNTEPVSQFYAAEKIAEKWNISRRDMEEFALESHTRARRAQAEGRFDREIVPFGEFTVDEGPRDTSLEKMASLDLLPGAKTLTAAVSSPTNDAASAVLIANEAAVKRNGWTPRARVHFLGVRGADPIYMLTAPINATFHALEKTGMSLDDIDLVEINEAFAPVVLAWQKETGADLGRVNVNGGAIALGHPIGATGTRLMTTLLHELERSGGRYGLQTMCEGGGQANATIIERL
ncbi:MAG: acetyl-CoA C-acetyltransferase [Actinomycetota bacterium]